jgi:ATP-binding cassette subfamily B protein
MPRGRRPGGFDGLKKLNKNTIRRLLSYITGTYKVLLGVVLVCILAGAVAGVLGSLFLQVLIDDYIAPLALEANPVFTGLLKAILIMGGIYLIGIF